MTNIKNLARLLFIFAGLRVSAFYLISFTSNKLQAAGPLAEIHPLTAEITRKMYSGKGEIGKGTLFQITSKVYAQFRDGSIVFRVLEVYPVKKTLASQIKNATTGEWMFLDDATDSVMTLKKRPEVLRHMISDSEPIGCPEDVDMSKLPDEEKLLGFRTLRYVTFPQDGVKDEKWLAPELGCFPLKEIQTSSIHNGAHWSGPPN